MEKGDIKKNSTIPLSLKRNRASVAAISAIVLPLFNILKNVCQITEFSDSEHNYGIHNQVLRKSQLSYCVLQAIGGHGNVLLTRLRQVVHFWNN